ncbi:MAG TPA: metallophosphoesterase [Gemmatimonadaceae bacterium]
MWLLLKVLAAITVYGTAIEPRFVVRENEAASIPQLSTAWEGKQIVVFADLQVGMWWSNRDAARRLVRQVVDINPAAVLIAGDFVYDADDSVDSQMAEVLGILQPLLDHRLPIYAVLGNHDYSLMNEGSTKVSHVAHRVRFALDSAGVHMMDNRAVLLVLPGADSAASPQLYLVGVGEKWAKDDSVTTALGSVPDSAPRIVFMHDPDSYAKIPPGAAPFAVAAHTHGLQIGIPYVSDWLWRHRFSNEGSGVAGWIDNYGQPGNRLYVNRGIGFSYVPARVHAAPELTVFTLTRGP